MFYDIYDVRRTREADGQKGTGTWRALRTTHSAFLSTKMKAPSQKLTPHILWITSYGRPCTSPISLCFLLFLGNLMPQSSAAIEERSHQERSEYFITEVISFVFTPYVIVILLILIYAVVCGKMSAEPLWASEMQEEGSSCGFDKFWCVIWAYRDALNASLMRWGSKCLVVKLQLNLWMNMGVTASNLVTGNIRVKEG